VDHHAEFRPHLSVEEARPEIRQFSVGFDIYSQNPATEYASGTMFHRDGMVIQYLSERVGFRVIGSNLTQLNNDKGPLPTYCTASKAARGVSAPWPFTFKVEKPGVVLQLRWLNEFEVTNLIKGSTLELGITLMLN
jgi:hypothetical protein